MFQKRKQISISTNGKDLYEITDIVKDFVNKSEIRDGLLNITVLHTSASLIVQENADYSVRQDVLEFFDRLCPESMNYKHNTEGKDDMPAHLRSLLTQNHLTFSVVNQCIVLGQWQGIVLCEHRNHATARKVIMTAHGKSTS